MLFRSEDVAEIVSMMSGVPAGRMVTSETERLRSMKTALQSKVIAQDEAVEKVVRAITRNRIGLKDSNRPIGTFMFVGPTGVGKTHLVKCLADWMFDRKDALIRVAVQSTNTELNIFIPIISSCNTRADEGIPFSTSSSL